MKDLSGDFRQEGKVGVEWGEESFEWFGFNVGQGVREIWRMSAQGKDVTHKTLLQE